VPRFSYIAKSEEGLTKTGFLEAKDETELAEALRQEGLFLISSKTEDLSSKDKKFSLSLGSGVGSKDKLFFIRNLRVMTVAGVALPRAIATLADQARNKNFKRALIKIQEKIIHGQSLSQSMQEYPEIFPEIFQNMVKVGEESGTLEQVLNNLALQLEKQQELKSKIVSALIYPLVVLSAMVGIGFLMLIIVVPQLAETFAELELTLPFTTRIVIWLGTTAKQYWYLLPIVIFGLVFIIRQILKLKSGKRLFDKLFLKLPALSKLVRETSSASFARTLSSLTASGVPLIKSLEIIAGTLDNVYFKDSLLAAVEQVKKGVKLSETLKPYNNLYLPIVVQMVEIGEETGETSQVLEQLATFLEDEVTNATKNRCGKGFQAR